MVQASRSFCLLAYSQLGKSSLVTVPDQKVPLESPGHSSCAYANCLESYVHHLASLTCVTPSSSPTFCNPSSPAGGTAFSSRVRIPWLGASLPSGGDGFTQPTWLQRAAHISQAILQAVGQAKFNIPKFWQF